ncbi:MAG: hypothetical protein KJ574_04700, partial [Nanoarchaeota archaeon]|nr:hypothetical protein [Nanoarchaeota archaeon]
DAGDDFASVSLYGCDDLKNILVCFTNTTFDEDELRTYIVVEINKTEPVISITRTISNTEFYAGEEQNVTISVTNTGDPATNATYYENWGSEFEIVEMEEGLCSIERSAIIWKGYIDEDKPLECTYRIRAKKDVEKGVVASLRYFNGFKMDTEYSSELLVTVNPIVEILTRTVHEDEEPVEAAFDWDADDVEPSINEDVRLALNLTNKLRESKWVDVDLKITYPKGIDYLGSSYVIYKEENGSLGNYTSYITHRLGATKIFTKTTGNVLEWSGRLRNNGTKEASEIFVLEFNTQKTGAHNLLLTAHYKDEDKREYTYSEYVKLKVINRGIKPIMYINDLSKRFEREETLLEEDDTIELESLNEYRLRMQIENINPFGKLKNLKVVVNTSVANFTTKEYSEIDAAGRLIPYSFLFRAPRTGVDLDYDMFITITGLTEFGDYFSNSTTFTARVNKFEDIDITHEFESTSLEGDEDSLVTTNLKNNRLVDLKNVNVTEYIDPRFTVEGVHARTMNLKADEDVDAYSYTLTAPRIEVENDTFYINTTVTYYDPDHEMMVTHSKQETMTVKPKELDLTITRTIDDNDADVGDILNIEYTLTNSEEKEIIKDIALYLPLQWEFDIVGPTSYYIERLAPGESITLTDKQKIKPKLNDTHTVDETLAVYYDVYGTRMMKNSSTDSIDIDKPAVYVGPAIFVNRTVPSQMYANESAKIVFRVVNKGNEPATVRINESGQVFTANIPANGERLVDYTAKISTIGTHTFEPALITYEYQGNTFTTISDKDTLSIVQKPVLFVEAGEEAPPTEEAAAEAAPTGLTEEEIAAAEEAEKKSRTRLILEIFLIIIVVGFIIAYIIYRTKGEAAPPILEE